MDEYKSPYMRRQPTMPFQEKDDTTFAQRERNFYLSPYAFIVMILILSFACHVAKNLHYRLPTPLLSVDESDNPGRFISENALNHITKLTALGPRTVGSFENEVSAVHILSKELQSISKNAFHIHEISIDYQNVSGAFSLQFLDGMTNVYRNVQNIILRIGPRIVAPDSILLNCHFDSVADSPGGSDDAAGCGVMLEILRVISTSRDPLKNNIIFLFNGAEENFLQGSHGFITQHPWARSVRAFINLEACGAGGKELLFQAGPGNPWLMEAYAASVPHPLANTLAEEVFQTGLIPGETDFRIFRDYGGVPGLDLAWAFHGYVYHTRLDNARQIPLAALQRTGDNILPLTLRLAGLKYPVGRLDREGNLVFFDILGLVMFIASERTGTIINWFLIGYSVYVLWKNSNSMSSIVTRFGFSKTHYITQLFFTCLSTLLSLILSFLFVFILSKIITLLELRMSWYSRQVWLFFLYGLPALIISLWVSNFLGEWQKEKMPPICRLSLRIDSNQALWTLALFITSSMSIRSSIIISSMLFFVIIANRVMHITRKTEARSFFLYIYFAVMCIPHLQFSYLITGFLLVIIPLFGRSGSENVEGVIAIVAAIFMLILFNFMIPLFSMVKKYKRILRTLCGIYFVVLLALVFTPLSFPYSSDDSHPAPQRYIILHVEQKVHGYKGEVVSDLGGLWVIDLDMNSPRSVLSAVPQMREARRVDSCERLLYCGMPYSIPVRSMLGETHWLDGPRPVVGLPPALTLAGVEDLGGGLRRYRLSVTGPDHMSLIISPTEGAQLEAWSFLEERPLEGPSWNGRSTYFVYLSYGSGPAPWNFSLDLRAGRAERVLDLALTGHFLAGPRSHLLDKFLDLFPDWTVTSGWVATYYSYKF